MKVPNLACLLLALAVSACSTPSQKQDDLGDNGVILGQGISDQEMTQGLIEDGLRQLQLSARIEKARGGTVDTPRTTYHPYPPARNATPWGSEKDPLSAADRVWRGGQKAGAVANSAR